MRGKDLWIYRLTRSYRITPAYAGKSDLGRKNKSDRMGSPPPMRGKVDSYTIGVPVIRITPAYAGKRTFEPLYRSNHQDHPRLCGEKPHSDIIVLGSSGSPPPMRGKVPDSRVILCKKGITPAYAGKRLRNTSRTNFKQDHPRLCGEKPPEAPAGCCPAGSPPPMRGKD